MLRERAGKSERAPGRVTLNVPVYEPVATASGGQAAIYQNVLNQKDLILSAIREPADLTLANQSTIFRLSVLQQRHLSLLVPDLEGHGASPADFLHLQAIPAAGL